MVVDYVWVWGHYGGDFCGVVWIMVVDVLATGDPGVFGIYIYWYRVSDTYCGSRAGRLGRGSWTLPRGLGLKCSAAGVGGTHAAMDDRGGVDVHELQHRDGLFLVHVYGYTVGAGRPVDGLSKTIQTAVQLIE